MSYNVDLALLIDCTGSMANAIDYAKQNALQFHAELSKAMESRQKTIDQLRVKVIGFRDWYCDEASQALVSSEFFKLPEQQKDLETFVNGLIADGGGDEPESALEAIADAIIHSDWVNTSKSRHVIVVWTDASAHELEKENKPPEYPSDIPRTWAKLNDAWGQKMKQSAKRLILFAPDVYPWLQLTQVWENTIHYPSTAGNGLEDVEFTTILNTIANSI